MARQATSEFALIDSFVAAFRAAAANGNDAAGRTLALGPGDDAALIRLPDGELLVATTDTVLVGRHFYRDMPAECIGWRALAVNLSDLAAMGATPRAVLVAATLPNDDAEWLARCAHGMGVLARRHGVALAGGNLSRGELSLSITALGSVPEGKALLRSGAQPGELLCVSGRIGSGAAGLERAGLLAANAWPPFARFQSGEVDAELMRYAMPEPRCELGLALRDIASAAVDISDGLLADAGHLCAASGVAAHLDRSALHATVVGDFETALRAGDDYELCFTVPAARWAAAEQAARGVDVFVTRIGVVVDARESGPGLWLDGTRLVGRGGFEHFSADVKGDKA